MEFFLYLEKINVTFPSFHSTGMQTLSLNCIICKVRIQSSTNKKKKKKKAKRKKGFSLAMNRFCVPKVGLASPDLGNTHPFRNGLTSVSV